jgi:hypothetical protein
MHGWGTKAAAIQASKRPMLADEQGTLLISFLAFVVVGAKN